MSNTDLPFNRINFILNDEEIETDRHPAYSLLDFIRKEKKLSGTKEVCKEGDCGACTILLGKMVSDRVLYKIVNSCLLPLGYAEGMHVVTIEGLRSPAANLIQKSFIEEGAVQCGYCTPGFIVALTGYLITRSHYSLEDALNFLDGNICRCTGYYGILRAINRILDNLSSKEYDIDSLISENILPSYFTVIPERLKRISSIDRPEPHISDVKSIAGGTDLMVQMPDDLLDKNIDLIASNGNEAHLSLENNKLHVTASCTVSELEEYSEVANRFPELSESLRLFGSKQIRNVATVGGNIVNASPIADIVNILLTLDTDVHISGGGSKRVIKLHEFFLDYKIVDLSDNERIDKIVFELPGEGYYFNFNKISKRKILDIASVNSSVFMRIEKDKIVKIKISAGGVSPTPKLLTAAGKFLLNKKPTEEVIAEAGRIALTEISPITDARGSADYKTILLYRMIMDHFIRRDESLDLEKLI